MVKHDGNFVQVKFAGSIYKCSLVDFGGMRSEPSLDYFNFRIGFHETIFAISNAKTGVMVSLKSRLASIISQQIELCSMMSDCEPIEYALCSDAKVFPERIGSLVVEEVSLPSRTARCA
jgi:hypothetical protein